MTTFLNFVQKSHQYASNYGQITQKRNFLKTIRHPFKSLSRALSNMRLEHYAAIGIVFLFIGQMTSTSIYYLIFNIIGVLIWCYAISHYFKQINPRYIKNIEYSCVIILHLTILMGAYKLGYSVEKNTISSISVLLLLIGAVSCVRTLGVLSNVELEFRKIRERALVLAREAEMRIKEANGYYFGGFIPIADRIEEVLISDKNISWEKALEFVVSKMIKEESEFNSICEKAIGYYVGRSDEKDACVFEPVNNSERMKLVDTIFNLYDLWVSPSAAIYYHFWEDETGKSMSNEILVDIRHLWFKSMDDAVAAILKLGLLREYAYRKGERPKYLKKFGAQDLIDNIPQNLMKKIRLICS